MEHRAAEPQRSDKEKIDQEQQSSLIDLLAHIGSVAPRPCVRFSGARGARANEHARGAASDVVAFDPSRIAR
jgi:hypothetical protein